MRAKATEDLKAAEERDDTEAVNKFSSRLVKVCLVKRANAENFHPKKLS